MASLSELFGSGSIGEQLLVYGALQQVIGAAIAPGLTELQQETYALAPTLTLSAETAAVMVQRGWLTEGAGASWAAKSGIGQDAFQLMIKAAQSAPPIDLLLAAFNRGALGWAGTDPATPSVQAGLQASGLGAQWDGLLQKMATQIPTVAEVMNAWLEGQIEEGEANTRYLQAGGDPTWFQTSYNANGQAPTPLELIEMVNRGVIPEGGTGPTVTSYEQGFLEGPWRNKWSAPYLALGVYVPPPRTVTALQREGSITQAQALQYYKDAGMSDALAAAYVKSANHTSTAAVKELSASTTVGLYADKLLTQAEALQHLTGLGYTTADATLLLAFQDAKEAAAATKSATTRIKTLYTTGKLTAPAATQSLITLGLDANSASELVAIWTQTVSETVRSLTPAEVTDGFAYDILDQATAQSMLVQMGYSDYDAWFMLSVKNKGALPDEPAGGPLPPVPAS